MTLRKWKFVGCVSVLGTLGGCATPGEELGLNAPGTNFYNPYRASVVDNGPVGPDRCVRGEPSVQLEVTEGIVLGTGLPFEQDVECAGDTLLYPGAGDFAFDRFGNRVRLSRSDVRQFQERSPGVFDRSNIEPSSAAPPVTVPAAPPLTGNESKEKSGSIGPNPRAPFRGGGSLRR